MTKATRIRTLDATVPVISTGKAAARLGVSRFTVRNWMLGGKLACRIVSDDGRGLVRRTSEAEVMRVYRELNVGT